MPFKLRLKKSRQYNVASKTVYVICVQLLDGSTMDCTLYTESIGRECLDSVCQRLGLQQPEFFGLRYISRDAQPVPRWVELDRPLKRQLDKYARDQSLFMRVMYYISGVNLIHDETTRYHYFLQLKRDVMAGHMSCDAKQAVLLASYCMQAEFGNHDPERHTTEYLKDFALFPKHVVLDGNLQSLMEAAVMQHAALVGLSQVTAEEYYILATQQLDGYGQETFEAKDEAGADVIIGVSLTGIFVAYENNQTTKYYRWKDITNVINHKRNFSIECQVPDETVQFQFPDPESAKYVWRMCVHQHTFFMQNEQLSDITPSLHVGEQTAPTFVHTPCEDSHLMDSCDDLDSGHVVSWERAPVAVRRTQSTSCLDLTDIDKLRALLPSYRPAPDYETAMQQKYRGAGQSSGNLNMRPSHQVGMLYSSQPEIHQENYGHYKCFPDMSQVYLDSRNGEPQRLLKGSMEHNCKVLHTYSTPELDTVENHVMQLLHLYKPPPPYPINRPSSNSTPDLALKTLTPPRPNSQVSGSSPDLVSSRSLGLNRQHHSHYQAHYVNQVIPSYHQILSGSEGHGAYSNLATDLNHMHLEGFQRPFTTSEEANIVYCVSGSEDRPRSTTLPYHSVNSVSSASQYVGGAPEPIYENIPLPWAAGLTGSGDVPEVRSRTSSIQSAPEMCHTQESEHTLLPSDTGQQLYSSMAEHLVSRLVSTHEVSTRFATKSKVASTVPVTEVCIEGSTAASSTLDKQKPKRKWGLLGGGMKTKSSSSTKGSKNSVSDDTQERWSMGLPRLPLPATISKETMCQLLERKLGDSQLFFEFERIPKKKNNADFGTALHPDSIGLNRYRDVLPYEENRVRLTPNKDNKHGYINASHITATVGNNQRFYIAAQAPLPNTVASFWQMIWEADIYLVIMLSAAQDEGTVIYWPSLRDRCMEVGELQIWQQFSQETGHCVTTKLRLYHATSRRMKGVWHLQYLDWGDQGCPHSVAHFLGFLEEVSSVRQHTISEIPAGHNRNPPVLVHCTAGVGRTGVMILSDLLLYTLDHNQELDIPRMVALLRHQRMLMVQTIAQYRFVYSLLIFYLKNSRLI